MGLLFKVRDVGKPFIRASIEVPRNISVPTNTRAAATTDLLKELADEAGIRIISGPIKLFGRVHYEVSARRSAEIPDAKTLTRVLDALLDVYERCLHIEIRSSDTVGFVDIDTQRPNVASQVFVYCLENRHIFTRRLLTVMKRWLSSDAETKRSELRPYDDEDVGIVPVPLSRREIRELRNTRETRLLFLECIDLFEAGRDQDAVALAKRHHFI